MTEAGTITSPTRALELLIGRARVAVRIGDIARVIAVAYGPLPLANRLIVGLGFDEQRTVVCISLTASRSASSSTKAVLLDTPTRIAFGLCIDEALELVDVVHVERGATNKHLPRWVRRARTADGRTIGWIDAELLIEDLTAPAVRS